MADLVGVIGVTHNPLMWSMLGESTPPDLTEVAGNFARLRAYVSELSPDVLVVVGSDHYHMLVTANMPAFMIGKAPRMRAIFPNEVRSFGMQPAHVPGERALAHHLLGKPNLTETFDFAFTDEPWLDHAFMVPLLLLDPGLEIPVVPVFTNTTAPPLPLAGRFAALGRYLHESIESFPSDDRVLLVGSGHLAHELGGPRQFLGVSPAPDFDADAVSWMRSGDIDSAVAESSFDRLGAAGNETHQFLNFITTLAAAGEPADLAEGTTTRFGALPFFLWEEP